MSRGLRPSGTLLATLIVGACASEPAYPPPTAGEARQAFVRALRADRIETPLPQPPRQPTAIVPGDTPGEAGRKAASVLEYESEVNSRAIAHVLLASLTSLTLGDCRWTAIDADDVKRVSRPRLDGIAEGYRCAYEAFHHSQERGRVSAEGAGYFFQRDGRYDFAEIEQATFEPVKQ